MQFVIEAMDPTTGGTVMLVCTTQGEASECVKKFQREGLEDIDVTDGSGNRLLEGHLV